MFEPIRGGTRGGQAEFKWSDVSADKDREHYLGHSINAPTGRWQKNKDVHWYNRDSKDGEAERQAEIRRIKEAEEDALAVALGFTPTVRNKDTTGVGSASPQVAAAGASTSVTYVDEALKREKEERRQLKMQKKAKKAEKKAKQEAKKLAREADSDSERDTRRRFERRTSRDRRDSRSLSPRRRYDTADDRDGYDQRRRSPLPHSTRRSLTPQRESSRHRVDGLNASEMERQRELDGRRWDANSRRYDEREPSGRRYR